MNECFFTPQKDTTSATICANCGKEKMLHTIGEGFKKATEDAAKVMVHQTVPNSHFWTDIDMLIRFLSYQIRNQNAPDIIDYLIIGLENCKKNGYSISKNGQSTAEFAKAWTDELINKYSYEWAEKGNGSGDKYFADCNFKQGLKWFRDEVIKQDLGVYENYVAATTVKESKCRFCGQPCIIDKGICYECYSFTK